MKNKLTLFVAILCLWVFWSKQNHSPHWVYGGAFTTQSKCERFGVIRSTNVNPLIVCLPAGLLPKDAGLDND